MGGRGCRGVCECCRDRSDDERDDDRVEREMEEEEGKLSRRRHTDSEHVDGFDDAEGDDVTLDTEIDRLLKEYEKKHGNVDTFDGEEEGGGEGEWEGRDGGRGRTGEGEVSTSLSISPSDSADVIGDDEITAAIQSSLLHSSPPSPSSSSSLSPSYTRDSLTPSPLSPQEQRVYDEEVKRVEEEREGEGAPAAPLAVVAYNPPNWEFGNLTPQEFFFGPAPHPFDEMNVNLLLRSYAKSQNMQGIQEVFKLMRERGMKPNVYHCTTAIKGCDQCGDLDKANEIFEMMKETGIEPNIWTYGSLIRARLRGDDVDGALHLLREVDTSRDLSANQVIYTTIIAGFVKRGEGRGKEGELFKCLWSVCVYMRA